MRIIPIAWLALAALCPLAAQDVKPKDVREAAKAGSTSIPKLQEFLKNPSSDVRNQAVRELIDIDRPQCIDPLVQATRDNDPEIQLLAQDVKPKDVREAAKAGSTSIPKLQEFLKNPSSDVRNQAVRELIDIDRPQRIDPLGQATTAPPPADPS